VNINVSNVVDLYGWQTGITFNPNVLECTGFYEGEFLKRSNETTLFLEHVMDMNNTLGIVYFRGSCILGPKPGINGSGQLAYVDFTSVGIGISDFHLTDVVLLNTKLEEIAFEIIETLTVDVNGTIYDVGIENNLRGVNGPSNPPLTGVFETAFSVDDKEISFDAHAVEDWYCQVSVPKTLLKCTILSEWIVNVDGSPMSYAATENSTHTLLQFEHSEGNHIVEIVATDIANGNPLDLGPPLHYFIVAMLFGFVTLTVALMDLKRTRKASTMPKSVCKLDAA
jgi:hypothetical protein